MVAATVVLVCEVAAGALEIDVVACWLEAVAVLLGRLVASRIYGCLAYTLVASADEVPLAVDMEVGTKLVLVRAVLAGVASALGDCRREDSACRRSWAGVDALEEPG